MHADVIISLELNVSPLEFFVALTRSGDRLFLPCVGEWLSLVEHLVRDQGVGGSNPLSPTISNQALTTLARNGGFTKGFTLPQALAAWA